MITIKLRPSNNSDNKAWNAYLVIRAKHVCFALLFLATVFTPSVELQAANVLLVTRDLSPNSDESARKSTFEGWGHTVTTIEDDELQVMYDMLLALNDLVWIPESIVSASVGYKLREATIPVVFEEPSLTDEMGFATYHGGAVQTNSISITNNTHPITSSLSLGSLSFTSSNQELITLGGSYAAGATVLATASSQPTFMVIDTGGQLANTYNGSNLAFGPRVKLPIGGSAFVWSTLTTDGLQLMQSTLEWAAGSGDDLLLHWTLDETSGSTAVDSSTYGRDGTIGGSPSLGTSARRSTGFTFESTDGADVVTGPNIEVGGDELTLAAWFKQDELLNESRIVMHSSGNTGPTQGWALVVDDSGDVEFRINADGTFHRFILPEAIDPGEWHHLVGVYDSGVMKIYLDGVLAGTESHPDGGDLTSFPSAVVTVGDSPIGSRPFDGDIDDVRIYGRALTEAEIIDLYGLIAHWKLDETSGTTAVDSSGSGHDATLTGTQGWTTGQDGGGHESDYTSGADDYFEAPSTSVLDDVNESNYTVMAYFKPNSVPPGSGSNNNASYGILIKEGNHLGLHYNNSQQFQIDHLNAGGSWHGAEADSTTYPPGVFYHVAGVVDYDAGTIEIYVDGVLAGTDTFTPGSTPEDYGSARWRLGIASPGAGTWRWPADGVIDDARIYNRALSAEEISQITSNELLAHWKLDETSGTIAADSSGHGSDGTYVGSPTLGIDAPNETGVTITDEAAYVTAVSSNVLNTLGTNNADFTIAFWVNPDSTGAGSFRPLFYKGSSGSDRKPGIWLDDNTNRITFHNGTTSNDYEGSNQFTSAIAQKRWSHIVCQKSGSLCKIYIDGVLDYSYTLSGQTVGNTGPVHLGSEGSTAHTAEYTLDDVRVYNRAISESEIEELALGSLVNHWKLDESSGTTAIDSGTAKLDGTHTNGVTINQTGPYPGAVAAQFDGSDDKVDIPDAETDFSGGFSIALWVNPSASPGAGEGFAFFDMSNGAEVDQIWFGWFDAVGLQLYMTDTDDGSTLKTIEDNTSFGVGKWVHCVVTVDSDGFATLYRNGQVTKSGFYTSLPTNLTRTQNSIGTSTFDDPFPGSLDDVRLYRYALTQKEVAELYGLVGHWEFDEGSGTTIDDSTDAASDASFNTGTPVWVEGVRGYALEFDGTNDAQTFEKIEPPADGAIAFWMRSDGQVASRQRQWGIGSDFETWQDTDGLVSMDIGTDGYQGGFITTERLDDKDYWYHIVAQYKSDDDTYEIYINGQLHKSGTSTRDIKQQAENYLTFGTRTGSTQRFIGALDDFRMYNRWLSMEEIAEVYGLVGWWRMEETSGTTVSDSSGAGNHGTLVGTPEWASDAKEGFGGLELDGTNYVEMLTLIVNDAPDGATVAGWAKLSDSDSGGSDLITLGDYLFIRLDQPSSDSGSTAYMYMGSLAWQGASSERFMEGGGWHHFVAVYDATALEIQLYIDGVLRAAESASGPIVFSERGSKARIGKQGHTANNRDFTGLIDDIRVYNRAITPSEARALYYGENMPGLRLIQWDEVANP